MMSKVGLAYFQKELAEKEANNFEYMLSGVWWQFGKQSNPSCGIMDMDILSLMTKSDAKQVDLSSLRQENILLKIIHIDFPRLSVLRIRRNDIDNIEAIVQVKSAVISIIDLSDNYISNLRSLRKIQGNRMNEIRIVGNSIRDVSCLKELNAPLLKYAYIEGSRNRTDQHAIVNAIAFQSRSFVEFKVYGRQRVNHENLWWMFEFKCGRQIRQ